MFNVNTKTPERCHKCVHLVNREFNLVMKLYQLIDVVMDNIIWKYFE